jgi:flagellin
MSDVMLSNGMRSNLLSLKGVAELFDRTQERVNTNRKVNKAADDPLNFFQSTTLRNRASGLERLLDGVGLGVKTFEASDNGLKAIERMLDSIKGLSRAALQSTPTNPRVASASNIDYRPNALGVLPSVPNVTSITIDVGIPASFTPALGFPAPASFTVAIPVAVADRVAGDTTGRAAQSVANAINNAPGNVGPSVAGVSRPYVAAEVDAGGRFMIENIAGATDVPLSTGTLQVQVAGGVLADLFGPLSLPTPPASPVDTGTLGGTANTNRARIAGEFRSALEQITNLAKDSGFNGVNLLNGQSLDVIFTEDATSRITIKGGKFDAENLNLYQLDGVFNFQSDTEVNKALQKIDEALLTLKNKAAEFAGMIAVVRTRQEFTKTSVKTLTIGAENLVLASVEEESANLLALQTRQQLSTQALSLAAQSEQAVLRLFG